MNERAQSFPDGKMPGSAAGCQQSLSPRTPELLCALGVMLFSAGTAWRLRETHPKTSGLPRNTDNTTYLPLETEATAGERADAAGPERRLCCPRCWEPWETLLGEGTPITVDGPEGPPAPLSEPQGTVSGAGTRILHQRVRGAQRVLLGLGRVCNLGCRFALRQVPLCRLFHRWGLRQGRHHGGVVASPADCLSLDWSRWET